MLTRAALGDYQKRNGLKVDCWPTAAVLAQMQGALTSACEAAAVSRARHADQSRGRPRKVGPFVIETLELVRAARRRADRPRRGERHVPDRSARPRRLFRQSAIRRCTDTKAPAWSTPSAARYASFAPGDHVVMSYPWCGDCANCRQRTANYCLDGRNLKIGGTRADGSTLLSKDGAPVYSAFFQQSSFGTFAHHAGALGGESARRRAA